MNFYLRSFREKKQFPCFVLSPSTWDDYGFKTTFELSFYSEKGFSTRVGTLKIMDRDNQDPDGKTQLDEMFEKLDDNYYSLGFKLDYYYSLVSIFESQEQVYKVLNALNDAACFPGIRELFEMTPAFQASLLRERESKSALQLGDRVVRGINDNPTIKFAFSTRLKNADGDHMVEFTFDKRTDLQQRIFAIVGKNGSGKTQFMSNLANSLSFSRRPEYFGVKKSKKNEVIVHEHELGQFNTDLGPPFGKVIAMSYSLFDTFKRPEPSKQFSYVYCGLRNEKDQMIDKNVLVKRHLASLKELNEKDRVTIWVNILSRFVDLPSIGYMYNTEWPHRIDNLENIDQEQVLTLSSGQSMLVYTLTELIAKISQDSFVLFDEPENHLHPNAIANLINSLNELVVKFDSFAIVATHSPIVVQQIPARNVYVFEREGNTPYTTPLDIESYGENLTTITKHIFETREVKDGYKNFLELLAREKTYEEILKMFDGNLSLNAKIFLTSLYNRSK